MMCNLFSHPYKEPFWLFSDFYFPEVALENCKLKGSLGFLKAPSIMYSLKPNSSSLAKSLPSLQQMLMTAECCCLIHTTRPSGTRMDSLHLKAKEVQRVIPVCRNKGRAGDGRGRISSTGWCSNSSHKENFDCQILSPAGNREMTIEVQYLKPECSWKEVTSPPQLLSM